MTVEGFFDLPQNAVGFTVREAILQRWRKGVYSYLSRPRPGYGVMLMMKGAIRFATVERELSAVAGNLIFLPKSSQYQAFFADETEDYLVNFEFPGLDTTATDPICILEQASLDVYRRYDELITEARQTGVDSLKSSALFLLLLDEIVKNSTCLSQSDRAAVARAKKMLDGDAGGSVKDIAHACGISESSLRQKFKASEGVTPIEYRTKRRIARATYLLETSELSVSEIAETLGFYDAPSFCRIFKNALGVTPREYLKTKQL